MTVTGVHHVNLKVRDVDEALGFYLGLLGLTTRSDRPASAGPGAWIDAGGQQIHLSLGASPLDSGQHFALEVDDMETAIADLGVAGIPLLASYRTDSVHQIVVLDPSGNRLELRQSLLPV